MKIVKQEKNFTSPEKKQSKKSTKKTVAKKKSKDFKSMIQTKKIQLKGIKNLQLETSRDQVIKKIRTQIKLKLKKESDLNEDIIFILDMSKAKPGFCIMKTTGEILYCISYPGSSKHKPLELIIYIEELILKYKPSLAIFESTFTRFKRAASVLSIYQGLAWSILIKHNIQTMQLSNTVVKNLFGCREKEDLFKIITELYSIPTLDFIKYNDEIDSIALGLTYLIEGDKILKKFQ